MERDKNMDKKRKKSTNEFSTRKVWTQPTFFGAIAVTFDCYVNKGETLPENTQGTGK